jgi:hypothetical protein
MIVMERHSLERSTRRRLSFLGLGSGAWFAVGRSCRSGQVVPAIGILGLAAQEENRDTDEPPKISLRLDLVPSPHRRRGLLNDDGFTARWVVPGADATSG